MEIAKIIEVVRNLPPTPQILPKLQKLLRDDDSSMEQIIDLIKMDTALTAQIVRLSNSAFFATSSPCNNVEDSVKRLGFSEVFKIVGLVASKDILGGDVPLYGISKGELWERSIYTAIIMDTLAQKLNLDRASVYTTGLLHPIGIIIINQYLTINEVNLDNEEDKGPLTPSKERQLVGFDNAQIGAALLNKWKFAPENIHPIEYQFSPLSAPSYRNIAILLRVAIDSSLQYLMFQSDPKFIPTVDPELLSNLKLSKSDFAETYKIAKPTMINVKSLLSA